MGNKTRILLWEEIVRKKDNRKGLLTLYADLIKWVVFRKGGLLYFNMLRLDRKENQQSEYLTIRDYLKLHDILNPAYYRPMLEDKIIFDRYVQSFGLPSPELLGIVDNGHILWLGNNTPQPLKSILSRSFSAYCKLVTSFGGKNILKVDVRDGQLLINNQPAQLEDFIRAVGKGKYILQRTIIQHKTLSKLNPSCVNSLRIYTISDGKKIEFYSSALRMGVDNSIVDNVSSNNIVTGVRDDGYLQEEAHSGFNPPTWHRKHPNSEIVFSEFQVPMYTEACDLCCKAHQLIGNFFYIAWDIAITEQGPVLIEGNPAADLLGPQILFGGQKKRFLKYAKNYMKAKGIS